jgi:hypothetical protein
LYSLPDFTSRIAFLLHPFNILALIIGFFLTFFVAKATKDQKVIQLTTFENNQSLWWFLNAIFIHFLLNGTMVIEKVVNFMTKVVNFFTPFDFSCKIPPYYLHSLYSNVDTRYNNDITSQLTKLIELMILFPLSCSMYYAIKTHSPWRAPIQILTATLQLFNTIIYICTEIFFQKNDHFFVHFSHFDPNFEFNLNHIIFFWFPILSSLVWIIIPIWFIVDTTIELSGLVELNVGNVINIGPKTFVFSPLAFNHGENSRQNDDLGCVNLGDYENSFKMQKIFKSGQKNDKNDNKMQNCIQSNPIYEIHLIPGEDGGNKIDIGLSPRAGRSIMGQEIRNSRKKTVNEQNYYKNEQNYSVNNDNYDDDIFYTHNYQQDEPIFDLYEALNDESTPKRRRGSSRRKKAH